MITEDRRRDLDEARPLLSRASSRTITLVGLVIVSGAALPFATKSLELGFSVLPSLLAATSTAGFLAAFVLFQRFSAGGGTRLLTSGNAFLFAATVSVMLSLSMPGSFLGGDDPNGSAASTAGWLWALGHGGFSAILAAGLCAQRRLTLVTHRRGLSLGISVSLSVSAALVGSWFISTRPSFVSGGLVSGSDTGALSVAVGPVLLLLGAGALVATVLCMRRESRLERWVLVSVAFAFAQVTLCLVAGDTATIGWQIGALLGASSPAIVILALVSETTALHQLSESDKRVLEDEALDLLREKRTLQYQQDRVRRIVDNAADAYVEMSSDGSIQGWNTKATDMFGRDGRAGSVAPASIFDNDAITFLASIWNDPDRFSGVRYETNGLHVAGHTFPVEMTIWVDESDLAPKMSMFVRDITVRRETEQRLQNALAEERRAVMRLQELDTVKNDFVSSISHELRSPLTSTLGYLEVLVDGDVGALTDRQRQMVEIAERNAKRLLFLIEDLLTLSHIESGTFGIKYKPVAVRDAVRLAAAQHVELAAQRDVELEVSFYGTLGVSPGEESQLVRALSSVINNAVKFTPPAGHVEVKVAAEGDFVAITVADNGIGIPQSELHRLFERFYKTSTSIGQQHQGAGLGLTISRAIIEHHGGTIEVKSTEGVGTEVHVRLPMLPSIHERHLHETPVDSLESEPQPEVGPNEPEAVLAGPTDDDEAVG